VEDVRSLSESQAQGEDFRNSLGWLELADDQEDDQSSLDWCADGGEEDRGSEGNVPVALDGGTAWGNNDKAGTLAVGHDVVPHEDHHVEHNEEVVAADNFPDSQGGS